MGAKVDNMNEFGGVFVQQNPSEMTLGEASNPTETALQVAYESSGGLQPEVDVYYHRTWNTKPHRMSKEEIKQ